MEAIRGFGSPPPRIVIGRQRQSRRQAPKALCSRRFKPDASRRRLAFGQSSRSAIIQSAACAPWRQSATSAYLDGHRLSGRGTTARERFPSGTSESAMPVGSCRGELGRCRLWQVLSPAASSRSRPVLPSDRRNVPPPVDLANCEREPHVRAYPPSRSRRQ